MVFYHVSFLRGKRHRVKTFVPRVPDTCAPDEDKSFPRICLTPTVEQCVQAMAPDSRDLRKGAVVTVYTAEISENDPCLWRPEEIADRVPDSVENQEYWYVAPLTMVANEFEIADFCAYHDLAWTIITVQDVEHGIENCARDKDSKDAYLNVVKMHCDSSYDAYCAVVCESERRGEHWIDDWLRDSLADVPMSSMLRVECLDLAPHYHQQDDCY